MLRNHLGWGKDMDIISVIVNIATVASLILSLITLRQSLKDKKEYEEKLRQIYSFQSLENKNQHLIKNLNESLLVLNECQREVDRYSNIRKEKIDEQDLDFQSILNKMNEMETKLDANVVGAINLNHNFLEIRRRITTIMKYIDDPSSNLFFDYHSELSGITYQIGELRKNMQKKIVELNEQLEKSKMGIY
jgi:hypothetical protein